MHFAEAVAGRDPQAIAEARQALFDGAGNDVVVDAAAVAGNFQRMVRIADSTGIPVDERMNVLSGSIQKKLDLRRFHSAQNTPQPSLFKRLVNVPADPPRESPKLTRRYVDACPCTVGRLSAIVSG